MTIQPMTGDEFRRIRKSLFYSQAAIADHIGMGGGGDRTVRRWESGEVSVPGPVAFCLRAMKAGYDPHAQEAQVFDCEE